MIQLRTLVFALVVLCQLGVPAWMILHREWTLRDGVRVKFKVEPMDPKDAVLGRSVRFRIPSSEVTLDEPVQRPSQVWAYALLEVDPEGFGRFAAVRDDPPEAGVYLRVRVRRSGKKGAIQLPFDRFYLPEDLVADTEEAAGSTLGSGIKEAQVLLRVHEGFGVVEDLYVQDTPILDYLKVPPEPQMKEGETP